MDDEAGAGRRRRWLVAVDPVFEGGRHGDHARAWDVEDEIVAVALFGDVTIDLSEAKSAPAEVEIDAYALLRDVALIVAEGTRVEFDGGMLRGDLRNEVPEVPEAECLRTVRVHGHALLGDVTARLAVGRSQ